MFARKALKSGVSLFPFGDLSRKKKIKKEKEMHPTPPRRLNEHRTQPIVVNVPSLHVNHLGSDIDIEDDICG